MSLHEAYTFPSSEYALIGAATLVLISNTGFASALWGRGRKIQNRRMCDVFGCATRNFMVPFVTW